METLYEFYLAYPECRHIPTQSRMYRNIILDAHLIIYRITDERTLPDDEVCRRLSQVRGVGVWTAEMLMIFSMQRKDMLSWDDMAILRGLRMLYRHQKITPELFATYKNR